MARFSLLAVGLCLIYWAVPVLAENSASADRLPPCERMFRWVVQDKVHFAQSLSWIKRSSYPFLMRLGEFANDCPGYDIAITGHTDSTGNSQSNQRLSQQRAQAVADFLVRIGVPRRRLTVAGVGSTEPVASNDTRAGREQNRRIEFALLARPRN